LIPFFSLLSNNANAANVDNVDNVVKVEITSKNPDNSQSLLPSKARYHANINGFELVATQQLHRDKQQWHANQSIISLLGTIEDSARFSIKNGVIIDADYQQSQNLLGENKNYRIQFSNAGTSADVFRGKKSPRHFSEPDGHQLHSDLTFPLALRMQWLQSPMRESSSFKVVNRAKQLTQFSFRRSGYETISTAAGQYPALKLIYQAAETNSYPQATVWLLTEYNYLLAKLLLKTSAQEQYQLSLIDFTISKSE
ncbi:MAG: DUF3108 domain-containing protein, partial [Pseudomonadales bacterium]|nr:DUF3108 domain-containing protein [Pseudomonadales bacterium]